MRLSLTQKAFTSAAWWSAGAVAIAFLAGAIRVMPWILQPAVPWRVALPFARSLVAIAVEAAVMVGWPMGLALSCHRFSERGEARVLSLLGESPAQTVARLIPGSLVFAAIVGLASAFAGADASAPGEVATHLVAEGRASCERADEKKTYDVPLVGVVWLCEPGTTPRLYGRGPGAMSVIAFTAEQMRIAGDMRRIDLEEATLLFAGPNDSALSLHAKLHHFALRGLSPWSSAATLHAASRAFVTSFSALPCALLAAMICLRRRVRMPIVALMIGAAGPLSALGAIRTLERIDAKEPYFYAIPFVSAVMTIAIALITPKLMQRLMTLR